MKSSNYYKTDPNYIDIAHIICAISVVILHTNVVFWDFSSTERYWKTANIIENIFYFAVPVFFMLTGATLLDFLKKYSLYKYVNKRIKKAMIPYLIWSIAGMVFRYLYVKDIDNLSPKTVFNMLLSGNGVPIYWFFISLFCVYLSIPLFAAVNDNSKKEVFSFLVVTSFAFNILIPFINTVFSINQGYSISISVGSGLLFYVLIGYLLDRYQINSQLKNLIHFFGIIGLFAGILGTQILSVRNGKIISTFKGYTNLPCVLYSIAVFVFIKDFSPKLLNNNAFLRLASILRAYTYPLYLLHWFILSFLTAFFKIDQRSIIWRLFGFVPIGIICIIITKLIRKIPILNKILP